MGCNRLLETGCDNVVGTTLFLAVKILNNIVEPELARNNNVKQYC